jgi:transposase
MMPQEKLIVGVDVSKAQLEVHDLAQGRGRRLKNTPTGWKQLIAGLPHGAVVGIEPSGGYESGVVRALLQAGADVRWTDPHRVRALAKAMGAPAKTDAIDAEMIALYVTHTGGRPVEIHPQQDALRELLTARSAALDTANRLKAQAAMLEPGPARLALGRIEAAARQEVLGLTRAAIDLVKEHAELTQPWRLLQTAPGIGPLAAAELLAHLPEIGRIDRKAIAKLTGLAPYVRESGAWRGRATCSGGRPRPRQLLYLAVMSALRCCPSIKARFDRLVAGGKPKMVALTACMRQLITALNAMLRDQKPWEPAAV